MKKSVILRLLLTSSLSLGITILTLMLLSLLQSVSYAQKSYLNINYAKTTNKPQFANIGKLTLVGQVGGSTRAVSRCGKDQKYICMGEGPRLNILDISQPYTPTLIGRSHIFSNIVKSIAITGNHALIAACELQIINLENPLHPTQVGTFNDLCANDIKVSGNFAYVADGGLKILDISDLANPTLLGSLVTSGDALGVTISGTLAYIADSYEGLRIIDVSNPVNPTEVGYYDNSWGYVYDVVVRGTIAYLADRSRGLVTLDVSNPAEPVYLDSQLSQGFGGIYDLVLYDDLAYGAAGTRGMSIIDIANPGVLIEIAFYDTIGQNFGLDLISGNLLYLADIYTGIHILNVSNPITPTKVGMFRSVGYVRDVHVVGNKAYVASARGIGVIDINDLANPLLIGFEEISGRTRGIYADSEYAYVAAELSGLRIIDISDPSNPGEIGYSDTQSAIGVNVLNSVAYIADGNAELRIIDLSNPNSPSEIGRYDTSGGSYWDVYKSGDYIYAADYGDGLQILDVSNPFTPTRIGYYDQGFLPCQDVDVLGEITVIGCSGKGMLILNTANPYSPWRLGTFDPQGLVYGAHLASLDTAIAAVSLDGISVLDISNPYYPTISDHYNTSGSATKITTSSDTVFVADDYGGLLIFTFIEPQTAPNIISINGPVTGTLEGSYYFYTQVMPITTSKPITYFWHPEPEVGQSTDRAIYRWEYPGTKNISVTVRNLVGSATATHTIFIESLPQINLERLFLPLLMKKE